MNALKNDGCYEERAIDVPFECPLSGHNTECQKHSGRHRKTDQRQNERRQSMGTVRSIPIKDYRASLAQDMETLRRSVVPQQQFESLVSEPERPFRSRSKRKGGLAVTPPSRKNKICCQMSHRKHNALSRTRNSTTASPKYSEFVPTFRFLKDYKCIRDNDSPQSSANHLQQNVMNKNISPECSNVSQKISVYEGNVRASTRRASEILKSSDQETRRRTLGVPLVGMHNACGLPVIASWPDHRFSTLRVPSQLAGRLGTSPGLRSLENQNKNKKKRRAPQPGGMDQVSRRGIDVKDSAGSCKKKPLKRSSFRTSRINSLPFKQRPYRRMDSGPEEKNQTTSGSLRRSIARRSFKRATLYAKNDGSEAVDVLTTLCLNPMARNKGALNMIW